MTDKEALSVYRFKQAEETLSEAERMVRENFSPGSIINRAYYSLFYSVLALFLKADINVKTSKHSGIISVFDKEFVKTGKIDKRYSKIFHDAFDDDKREIIKN
ncbi:MAG: HEPN domain-containing protein [Candidatus Jettenia sp.]|uniref:HEPN domain-containing protein n=1 Tax=Candidatus Jettenia caeni TaxID=247490 RepID=I3IHL9_9BACT|nr:HEPN domain-containing protein [Candidatus Jettenia sp. AMX1]MBC6928518.1 HEPN domain-containing protein [Candidatus Jettenia sp.]NUN23145.1 HEPN domain-containing protein [Candidatus Jettenia caeni]KAA0251635.1 MAG: HEPN domain-containing protein [Candidatus Jettenia sp. AMX1]MCE7879807.1 HEPN domain-containing protein [Candidatus Jettenia sp. AMX1]MCQ3925914.1 HEPN domain-containing protein [Candidatus Jettenia sp.]